MAKKRAVTKLTIYDIAREAGVSHMTVSRVINNNPRVNPDTRIKILKIIEKRRAEGKVKGIEE